MGNPGRAAAGAGLRDAGAEEARRALGVPAAHRRCTLDGVELAFDDTGSGIPVVCLHAAGHGAGDFEPFRARMGGSCRIVRLDWPGQGRSSPDRLPASADRYSELLDRFLEAQGIAGAVLIGNSIGGAAAIRYAAAKGERVRGLVLANPAGLAPVNALARGVCRAMVAFFRSGVRGAAWYEPAFRLYYRRVLSARAARERRRQIVAAARALAPVQVEAWASFAEPQADLRALAPKVACPVWLPWARHDALVAYRRSRRAIRRLPDARVQLFPGGHAAFLEHPDLFAREFRAFLAEIAPQNPQENAHG